MHTLGPLISPDYQGVPILQVSLYDKAPFGTITKCVDYMQVSPFSNVLINRFTVVQIFLKYLRMCISTKYCFITHFKALICHMIISLLVK